MSEESTELRGLDPRKPFYLTVSITNPDGSLELFETSTEWETLDEALIDARVELEGTLSEIYIYECRPIKRVTCTTIIEDIQSPLDDVTPVVVEDIQRPIDERPIDDV